MAKLSLAQIQDVLRQVGFPENLIAKMAGIAIYESAGKTDAYNGGIWYTYNGVRKFSNESSMGLWQINHNVHKNYSLEQLKDPIINATEALRIYRSQGFNAWVLSNGKYDRNQSGTAQQSRDIYNSGGSGYVNVINDSQAVNDLIDSQSPTLSGESDVLMYGALALLGIVIITR